MYVYMYKYEFIHTHSLVFSDKKNTHQEYVNIIDRRVEDRATDMSIFKNLIDREG